MSITAIIGAQYGSEGKGKIAAYLANEFHMAIRTGGPNAGHTIEHAGTFYKLQSIPCTVINSACRLAIGAGGVIDLDILQHEIAEHQVATSRLVIDPQAAIIGPGHIESEATLKQDIGSTGKGVGAAVAAKARRAADLHLARDSAALQPYLGDVTGIANEVIARGGRVLLEGTQGFGLSLHHGIYPFVTSRDTTAGTLCGDAGVSPRLLDEIILVVRTYPIRVAGNSGPLRDEITWEEVTRAAHAPKPLIERTTVTRNIRRVGRFDLELVKRAVLINRPTQIAVTFIDYIDHANAGKRCYDELTADAKRFIAMLEHELGIPVTLISTGPHTAEMIDLRADKRSVPRTRRMRRSASASV
jgi:adenylosuccinate synthase